MGSSFIAIAIMCGVAVLAVAAYIAQNMENARQERRRKTLQILQRVKKADDILSTLPAAYLPADIRQFLLQFLQRRYQEVLQVDPKNADARQHIEQLGTQLSQDYKSSPDSPEPALKNPIALKQTAQSLKDMVNFFVGLHNENAIDTTLAKRFINKGKTLFAIVKLDRMQLTAQQTEAKGSERAALVQYSQCRKRMEPFVKQNILPQRAKFLDEKISTLNNRVAAMADAQPSKPTTANKEWDQLGSEDDWKIKQEYET